jgi:uroporphyrinogen III methyltransferase/synthase
MKEARPLLGRRIVVTRSPAQAGDLVYGLLALGATVIEVPAIEVAPPLDPAPLDLALHQLERYDWGAFTSPNTVASVKARLEARGAGRLPSTLSLASVGRATTEALRAAFPEATVRLEPAEDYSAEGLLRAFTALAAPPRRVLLPCSDRARPELAAGLRGLGSEVDTPVAYRTLTPADLGPRLEEALSSGVDLFIFASPSAVQGLADALGARARGLPAITIGPTTADAARAAGLRLLGVASPSTSAGLVDAAVAALARGDSEPSP